MAFFWGCFFGGLISWRSYNTSPNHIRTHVDLACSTWMQKEVASAEIHMGLAALTQNSHRQVTFLSRLWLKQCRISFTLAQFSHVESTSGKILFLLLPGSCEHDATDGRELSLSLAQRLETLSSTTRGVFRYERSGNLVLTSSGNNIFSKSIETGSPPRALFWRLST